jgi:hypothetical protein
MLPAVDEPPPAVDSELLPRSHARRRLGGVYRADRRRLAEQAEAYLQAARSLERAWLDAGLDAAVLRTFVHGDRLDVAQRLLDEHRTRDAGG